MLSAAHHDKFHQLPRANEKSRNPEPTRHRLAEAALVLLFCAVFVFLTIFLHAFAARPMMILCIASGYTYLKEHA